MFRYSVLTLLVVVLVLAVFCAALAKPNGLWWQVIVTLSIVVLLAFTLLAVVNNRSRRPFVLGFVLTGWLYFGLTFATLGLRDRDALLTNGVANYLASALHGHLHDQVFRVNLNWSDATDATGYEAYQYFMDIVHCLWTLVLAAIGGLTTTWLAKRESRPRSTPKTNLDQP